MNGHSEKRSRLGIWPGSAAREPGKNRSWQRRISDNLAYGLLVYTCLQIFVTMKQLKELSHTMLPYLALIVLVAGIIPAARALERHWVKLGEDHGNDPAQASRFRRDRAIIWLSAIGLPFLLAGLARCAHGFTG